jgi:translation initiation factor RLI1
MSKEEIKYEINKVLDHFSDKALEELLSFLKELDSKNSVKVNFVSPLNKILSEDKELLAKLAQ